MATSGTDTRDAGAGSAAERHAGGRIGAAVAVFVVVAYGLAWAISLPLWRTGGLAPGGRTNPLLLPLGLLVMTTPAIGAVVATLAVLRPAQPARFLGLAPLRPLRRTLGYSLVGLVAPWVLATGAILLGAAAGLAPLQTSAGTARALAAVPVLSLLIAVPALGEELGWRGFLLPLLRPLGTWPALLISGLLWGPWHAPVVLLGYNYGLTDARGVLLMTVTTVLVGVLFGWLRMRSASVYPSAFAHGSLNGASGLLLAALLPAGSSPVGSSLLGWAGWLLVALLAAVLALLRTFRWAPQATCPGDVSASACA